MDKVYLVIHEEVNAIYGCCTTPQAAESFKNRLPNPDCVEVKPVPISDTELIFL